MAPRVSLSFICCTGLADPVPETKLSRELRRQLEDEVAKREELERTVEKAKALILSERQQASGLLLAERRLREQFESQESAVYCWFFFFVGFFCFVLFLVWFGFVVCCFLLLRFLLVYCLQDMTFFVVFMSP